MCYLFIITILGEREEQGVSLGDDREQTRQTNEETKNRKPAMQAKAAGSQDVSFDLKEKDTGPKELKLSQYP